MPDAKISFNYSYICSPVDHLDQPDTVHLVFIAYQFTKDSKYRRSKQICTLRHELKKTLSRESSVVVAVVSVEIMPK